MERLQGSEWDPKPSQGIGKKKVEADFRGAVLGGRHVCLLSLLFVPPGAEEGGGIQEEGVGGVRVAAGWAGAGKDTPES